MSKKRVRAGGHVRHGIRFHVTCGIDTDRDFLVCAFYDVDAPDHVSVVEEFPQTNAGIDALIRAIQKHQVELTVIESTGQYHANAYNRMAKAGLKVLVVNPLTIKALLRVEGKSDKRDAATLARLAATFDLRASNMPDEQQEALRYLFKVYDQSLQARVRTSNRLGALLTMHGCRLMTEFGRSATRDLLVRLFLEGKTAGQIAAAHPLKDRRAAVLDCVNGVTLPPHARTYATWLFGEYQHACEQETKQAKVILAQFDVVKDATLWAATVPGTTPELLIRLVAECGPNFTDRYATCDRFCNALGVAPRSEVSGGKLLKVSDAHGNVRMITALTTHYKAYMLHVKGTGPLAEWLADYRARTTFSKTLLALCHKVAAGWWQCTRLKTPYDEYKAFGRQRPAHPVVETVSGLVDTATGEILDDTPIAVHVPYVSEFMALAQAGLDAQWRYRHEGD
jgi:hypothetical protein